MNTCECSRGDCDDPIPPSCSQHTRDDREDGFGAHHSRDDVGCTQRRAGRPPLYIIKGVVDKTRGVYSQNGGA